MTQAVIRALQERLERLRVAQKSCHGDRAERLMEHGRRFAALPVADRRSPDEVIGYDEVGLPR